MSIVKFLTSKTFFKHLAIAFGIVVVLVFVLLKFLDIKTNHGEEIPVPDLSKMQVKIAQEKLEELGLELILLDTVDFRNDMPPYSIVEQDPKAENTVKNGRKIYVKVNAGEYDDVTLPALKGKTFRQVSANIKSLGLKEGKITYKPHLAKDEVLAVTQKGKTLKAGDKVKKNSTLDFVLGDGKEFYDEQTFDKEETTIETPVEDAGE
ncbi:PASTA domain-containing protein [Flavobacterium okayamense]|uniref:PASTA domain-containing protein n=1 Tax=Flavobacterium okayamense TaxID=2830782 RepID=A0ABM7SCJ0_9FLAO|nr:PASTA domain-containing protein [Flavobacterium okayamense]BCY28912.1 PASTA domain-containing protein [Flavobacterium okayamense]